MKLEELYESILEEGISPVLFHATTLKNGMNIVREDKFRLSYVASQKELELSSGKKFYLSTARTKTSSFMGYLSTSNMEVVRFRLDGRRLQSNLKGNAVDFYSDDRSTTGREQEDRISSHKPDINNAKKFIVEIDVLIPEVNVTRGAHVDKILSDLASLEQFAGNIPISVFTDNKQFTIGRNGLTVQEFIRNYK